MAVKTSQQLTGGNADLWKRGKGAFDTKNLDYAISLLQTLLKTEPAFIEGRQILRAAEIQKAKGQSSISKQLGSVKTAAGAMKAAGLVKKDPSAALVAAEEVLAVDPFHQKANEALSEAGTALGLPEIAVLALDAMAEGNPKDTKILHNLANLCMARHDYERAIGAYERILKIDPRDGDAQSGQKNASARLASSSGGWEGGGDFRSSLKNKGEASRLEQENKVVKSEGAVEEQIARLSKLVADEPDNLNHPKKIADLYRDKGDVENAIQWYEYVYEKGGRTDASLEKTLGTLHIRKVDNDIAAAEEAVAAAEPNAADPETAAYLGQMTPYLEQLRTYRKQLALETAKVRVQKYPNEKMYHYELGRAFVDLEMYREALPPLQEGKKAPSVRLEASNLLGVCQWKLNMFDLAEKTLRETAHEIPIMSETKKEILYNLASVLEAAGKKPDSIETLKQIYEVDISYRDVAARVEASYGAA